MGELLLLSVLLGIYSTYGLLFKEESNGEFLHINCPLKDEPRFHKIVVHPSDCSKYFLCKNGTVLLEACPKGLHFNEAFQLCDYPENVSCEIEKMLEKKLLSLNYADECPQKDGAKPTYLPHPSDCGKFYICHAGIPHLKICLPGLHFNTRLEVCDYPDRAGCAKIQSSKSRDKLIEDELMGCLTDKLGKHFIPNPRNCSEYTICEKGHTLNVKCSSDLHFNIFTKTCDHPDRAKCSKRKDIPIITSIQLSPGVPNTLCPAVNGKDPIFLNHPSNCSEYYMCSHGLAYKFACPARLHFNLRRKVCDYEWLAQCLSGADEKNFN